MADEHLTAVSLGLFFIPLRGDCFVKDLFRYESLLSDMLHEAADEAAIGLANVNLEAAADIKVKPGFRRQQTEELKKELVGCGGRRLRSSRAA